VELVGRDYRTTGFRIVLALLLASVAVGVWWMRLRSEARLQGAANERNASTILIVLADAEVKFRDGNGVAGYWTSDVAGLGPLIPPGIAAADASHAGCKPRTGYYVKALPVRERTAFAFCAYPSDYPRSGKWTFVINESRQLYRVDTRGEPITSWKPDPATWKPME